MKKKNISSWLFTTAKNAALNYRKKHSREIFEIDENWDSEEDTEKYEAQVSSAEEQFLEDDLQKLTDKYVKEVDKAVEAKSKEVMTV